ncbi:MAG: hypothetical protein ACREJD_13205 [Phycisphaerales bacterium]
MDARVTTWSGLLAVWSDFARAAGALPKTGDLGLLRRSVPAIIGLQSLTQALEHIDCLPPDEYCSGQDRASLITRTLRAELNSIWRHDTMPAALVEMLTDADTILERTRRAGYEFVPEADPFAMPVGANEMNAWRTRRGFRGTLFAAPVARRVRAGLPVLFVMAESGKPLAREDLLDLGALLPGCLWGRVKAIRQVYETPDPRGVRQVAGDAGQSDMGSELLTPLETHGLPAAADQGSGIR